MCDCGRVPGRRDRSEAKGADWVRPSGKGVDHGRPLAGQPRRVLGVVVFLNFFLYIYWDGVEVQAE